jgi:hypothetical protein
LIANSDLHRRRQITSWKTVVRSEAHPEAVLDAIRRQDVRFRFFSDPKRPPVGRPAARVAPVHSPGPPLPVAVGG